MKKEKLTCFALVSLLLANIAFADVKPVPATPEAPAAPAEVAPLETSKKAFLGVVTDRVRSSTAVQLGITPGIGLTIDSVVKGSSADEYGIEKYDILLEMDGQMLTSGSHFSTLLSMKNPGDEVVFLVFRKGEKIEVPVTLGSKGDRSKTTWKFETKMEQLGEKLEELAEKHEIHKFLGEDAKMIEEKVRAALEGARYHIEAIDDQGHQHTTRTSIINSGSTRTIESSEEGTLIVEPLSEEKFKLIAINADGDMIFKGEVSSTGEELKDYDSWVKRRFLKMNENKIRVIVTDEIEVEEVDEVYEDDEKA